ncbi:hypothetical protein B0H14DRAFT_2576016 [Mycena olivaceomarginata]|nr:hypothetical protein B0H14DRAFT_2576016 [Mycena olivaceomarginata]
MALCEALLRSTICSTSHLIKSTLPKSEAYVSLSGRTEPNFVKQFERTPTIDFVPYLSVSAALDFRQWLGGEEKINTYCQKIAIQGSDRLVQILGTAGRALDPSGEMTLNMIHVQLPPPPSLQTRAVVLGKLKKKTDLDRNTFALVFSLEGMGWCIRCSAQVWTEVAPFFGL